MSSNPFEGGSGEKIPTISFTNTDPNTGVMTPKPIGTRLGGRVTKAPEVVQKTKFGTGEKQYWDQANSKVTTEDTGRPLWDVVIGVDTPEGPRNFWFAKSNKEGSMFSAIKTALGAAGVAEVKVGGELYVTLTGVTPNPKGGQPSKQYSATYTPPNPMADEAPAAAAVPAPPAPPAPPAAEKRTADGYTLASLVAAGWTAEQAVAAYPELA